MLYTVNIQFLLRKTKEGVTTSNLIDVKLKLIIKEIKLNNNFNIYFLLLFYNEIMFKSKLKHFLFNI